MAPYPRLYVERKAGRDYEARAVAEELRTALGLKSLEKLRILTLYEISGLSQLQLVSAAPGLLADPSVDNSFLTPEEAGFKFPDVIAREYLPGTFDHRADSAERCLRLIYPRAKIEVRRSDIFIPMFDGSDQSATGVTAIRNWLVNPVESRIKVLSGYSVGEDAARPAVIPELTGFLNANEETLDRIRNRHGIALNQADMLFVRDWFRDIEKRDPTLTELKVLDTYWSDHCRHTTFETELAIEFSGDPDRTPGTEETEIRDALAQWEEARRVVGRAETPHTLMDLATIAAREALAGGKLEDWDVSEEINACTVRFRALINGRPEDWLISFKNETHNHPTEIEPFGGASTCIGGAVRDPLSGRAFVHQALRVSGGADPRTEVRFTRQGKLPQRLIAHGAAEGYSSYGNQLGLPTTIVREHYHPGYEAKRLECGAVLGASPEHHVVRKKPKPGNVVILVGGRTGRDGIGGATGSSVAHSDVSLEKAGSEVQKGNAPEERKLQRLFRRPEASRLIRRCNDFGAGGVAVAIGELADGLEINLDAIPVKYSGLNGLELALSESQERMAIVVKRTDVDRFVALADRENLDASPVARVNSDGRMRMLWNGDVIVDLPRKLLDSNGVRRTAVARILASPAVEATAKGGAGPAAVQSGGFEERLKNLLSSAEIAARLGLEERFDGSVGGTTVLAPRAGLYQLTPAEASVHLLPAEGKVESASAMSVGFDPYLAEESPFRGGQYSLIEAISRIVAVGAPWRRLRFSLQEYFGSVERGAEAWSPPLCALLGALTVQRRFSLPAIGGKDSMSGSFQNLDVPPTIIAFAAAGMESARVVSAVLSSPNLTLVLLSHHSPEDKRPDDGVLSPDFDRLELIWDYTAHLIQERHLKAAASLGKGGWPVKLILMSLGNRIGISLNKAGAETAGEFLSDYGSMILAVDLDEQELVSNFRAFSGHPSADPVMRILGNTISEPVYRWKGGEITLQEAENLWRHPFSGIWPENRNIATGGNPKSGFSGMTPGKSHLKPVRIRSAPARQNRPRVLIPVFAGTNGEDDAVRSFRRAGALPDCRIFRDRNPQTLEASLIDMADGIQLAQILYISGGFSAGDEPDGAGKYIAAILRFPRISDSIAGLLDRGGLVLGICNGFQALIKSGWLVEGRAALPEERWPTLVRNSIGRHVSRICRTVSSVNSGVSSQSPWLNGIGEGDIHSIPVSHGEGRFRAAEEVYTMFENEGRFPFRYCNYDGLPTIDGEYNPNGSDGAVEALLSPCGRILGKMGHSERWREGTFIDVPGMERPQPILEAGVAWFR